MIIIEDAPNISAAQHVEGRLPALTNFLGFWNFHSALIKQRPAVKWATKLEISFSLAKKSGGRFQSRGKFEEVISHIPIVSGYPTFDIYNV